MQRTVYIFTDTPPPIFRQCCVVAVEETLVVTIFRNYVSPYFSCQWFQSRILVPIWDPVHVSQSVIEPGAVFGGV